MIGSCDFFCKNGWESDNDVHADSVFVDVDEYNANSSQDYFCDVNTACANTAGSYVCNCNRGWESEGFDSRFNTVCLDVDECDASASLNHARDVNVDRSKKNGSYVCFYNRGWESNSDGQFDTVALTSVNVTPMPALITLAMLILPAPTMTDHIQSCANLWDPQLMGLFWNFFQHPTYRTYTIL